MRELGFFKIMSLSHHGSTCHGFHYDLDTKKTHTNCENTPEATCLGCQLKGEKGACLSRSAPIFHIPVPKTDRQV